MRLATAARFVRQLAVPARPGAVSPPPGIYIRAAFFTTSTETRPGSPRSVSRSPIIGHVIRREKHSSSSNAPPARQIPIEMAYDVVEPSEYTAKGQSLVICHGLFGSKQNWRSLAKLFASKLGMPVYTLDLRNHGISPHAEPHTYSAMAQDIAHFLSKHNLQSGVNLMGHSMGGKAVMAFALNHSLNKPLRSLISVDMSPAIGKISPEFAAYTASMMDVEKARVKTKHEADAILKAVEPSLPTRQFLLTNTRQAHGADPHLVFRIPLQLLSDAIKHIGDFPYSPPPPVSPTSPIWDGPTLFLKGAQSKYINRKNIPVAEAFFPKMKLETLDTGHWVHAEKPNETVELVKRFVQAVDA
ncbi:mitochondrial protein [Kwoniella heveanensis CBS 569]|uniref:Mitochondrial protein n=1 Tax=Kwoniella heveanensis BCC8398 TaxID=1296120 RepID=A0A1B9GUJ3_9TREE|nr:mitochondrial protein [Kwoniella heveanensis BCC8398]OCF42388.1 mitochondrial protein [Kwoniella heveanensis CBS 569]